MEKEKDLRITKKQVVKSKEDSGYVDLVDDLNQQLLSDEGPGLSLIVDSKIGIVRLPDDCVVSSIRGTDQEGPCIAFTRLTVRNGIFAYALLGDPFNSQLTVREASITNLIAGHLILLGPVSNASVTARSDMVAVRKGSVYDVSGQGKIIGGNIHNPKELLYVQRLHPGIEISGAVELFSSNKAIRTFEFNTHRKELMDEIVREVEGKRSLLDQLTNSIKSVRRGRLKT